MRILIVEDEVRLAEALGQIMEEQKYMVDIAYDGEEGYDYAMGDDYDVIVLDVMLPKMNGFQIVKNMRINKNSTPVILLTEYYVAAEPPVRCGESHLSRQAEPPCCYLV